MMQCLSRFFAPKKLMAVVLLLILMTAGIFFWKNHSSSSPSQLTERISSELSGPWEAKLQMDCGDFSALCQFRQQYIGEASFQFLAPPSLEGFGLEIKDQQINLSYHGMKGSISADRLMESSGAGMFLEAIDSITRQEGLEDISEKDSPILTLAVPSEDGEPLFSMSFDENGIPLSLSFPQKELTITITDFVSTSLSGEAVPEKTDETPEEETPVEPENAKQ